MVKSPDGYSTKCKMNSDWIMRPLPMKPDFLNKLEFSKSKTSKQISGQPAFFKFVLSVENGPILDGYIDPVTSGLTKGVIFVNGRNLGRYWNIGPQKTLYLPGPWLKLGNNEIIVFDEMPNDKNFELSFSIKHELGPKNLRPA